MKVRKWFSVLVLAMILVAASTWLLSVYTAASVDLGWRGQRSYTVRVGFDAAGWVARFDAHPFTDSAITGRHRPVFDAALASPRTNPLDTPLVDASYRHLSLARHAEASAHHGVIILGVALLWALIAGRKRG